MLSLSGDRGLAKASPGCGLRHEQPRDMHSGEWLVHALLRGGSGTPTLDVKDPGTADLWAQTKTRGEPQCSFSAALPGCTPPQEARFPTLSPTYKEFKSR